MAVPILTASTSILILAGQDGGCERSPQAAVPEPSGAAMIFLGLVGLLKIRQTHDRTKKSL